MQQFQDRLPVNRDRKFCYDIVFRKDFDTLFEESCRITPDFAAGASAATSASGKDSAGKTSGGHTGDDGKDAFPYTKVMIVTDSAVAPLYLEEVRSKFTEHGIMPVSIVIEEGETQKTLDTVRSIYKNLIEQKFDRRSVLIALGGGVVGDITGFTAATYLRGIDYIQIPTTLLAQSDSSIGGKTGVDFDGYKNMVGAFKMPKLVYENISTLKTLDGRQFASGFAEVMKSALIRDEEFYVWLLNHLYEIRGRDVNTLQEMVYNSDLIKKLIVEKDPYEKSERRLLNFGHTLGHAIEKYKNFSLTHGECVALGCVAASFISWKKELISKEEYYEIRDMFVPFGLPISVEGIDEDRIIELAHSDKKAVGGTVPFVLLKSAGRAFVANNVSDEEMREALREIEWTEDGE
jgi:3-dehydroquinate synthase